jgi:hypothetical protein
MDATLSNTCVIRAGVQILALFIGYTWVARTCTPATLKQTPGITIESLAAVPELATVFRLTTILQTELPYAHFLALQ